MTLNEAQEKAVMTSEGPVLVIAGAGAGKTRVITHRILNLIKNGASPGSILAITFTNKAAKEMRERIMALLGQDKTVNRPISLERAGGWPFISTFHALGVHIIRENAQILGLNRHFTIYDRADSRRAVKSAMEQVGVDPKSFDPASALNMISRAKGDGINFVEYRGMAKGYTEEVVSEIWEKYSSILRAEKALDFDDLLLKAAELLRDHSDIREHYAKTWKYIHIDEYQDTNRVQYLIATYLTSGHKNIFVVGDADQNIYSWRGATIENILNFEKDYPQATVILLEKNYRSTKNILEAANKVIEKNRLRQKKVLRTDNSAGEKISLLVSYSETEEARLIADRARELIRSRVSAREIAVLYRTNFQSRILEEFFIKKGVPYQMIGTKFFERKEVKDVLSYLRAALNTESWADLNRIINVPPRGIGKATLAKIISRSEHLLPAGMQSKIKGFWKLLADIQNSINNNKPSETVRFILKESGMEEAFREGKDHARGEGEDKLLNVRELVSVAAQYDHLNPEEGIEALLTNAALATDQDELAENPDAVKLMTVHASKGLEFEHVFVAGMEQDLFPLRHLDESEISRSEEEEERRLFYVALTRAKIKVHLSYAVIRTVYGSQRVNAPSEFIADIGKDLIEEHSEESNGSSSGAKAIFIDF